MAAAYVKIYCNGEEIRTFGGNKSDVRRMKLKYEQMTKEQFLKKHRCYAYLCENEFKITCDYFNK